MEGASAAAHALSLPADAYGNDVSRHDSTFILIRQFHRLFVFFQVRLEAMWAIKAGNHAEVYFNVSVVCTIVVLFCGFC